jgi:hypothetical protein
MVKSAHFVESLLDQGVQAECPVDGFQRRCKWMKKFPFEGSIPIKMDGRLALERKIGDISSVS